jgi:8-oxo-dGTP pyrophosphatase MutT (NUDIX family)
LQQAFMSEEAMGFEPQKFFIGVLDFFSILLPGALLTFVLRIQIEGLSWAGPIIQKLEGAKGWVAFLVASYLLGHLAFLLGSWLDEPYDWLRSRTQDHQIRRLARANKTFRWWVRFVVWLVFKRERGQAVELVKKIKEKCLAKVHGKKSINNFQWSKALLTLESPDSLAVVHRLEADSKFFRCFVIVVLVAIPFLRKQGPLTVVSAALLILAALWRYMEQRYKATNQAYWSVITLAGKKGVALTEKKVVTKKDDEIAGAEPAKPQPTHAGGVVFRKRWFRQREYLLVEASKTAGEWVLPKGKIESDEDIRETAIREVHEETGVWARITGYLGDSSYTADKQFVTVRVFLMQQVARGFRNDPLRQRAWLPLEKARERARHQETRELLDAANQSI